MSIRCRKSCNYNLYSLFGHFKYLRASYSLLSTADLCNCHTVKVFENLFAFRRVIDDIVRSDKDEVSHVEHVKQFVQQCKDRKIALNKEKWKYCRSSDFCRLSTIIRGLYTTWMPPLQKQYPTFLLQSAILNCNLFVAWYKSTHIRNQHNCIPYVTAEASSEYQKWIFWSANHALTFSKIKGQLVTSKVLALFDLSKLTWLCTDTSRQGLGFALQQQSTSGK